MKTADIIEGLTILEKYRDEADCFNTGAEHDVIYAYKTDRPVEQPDLDRMVALGWFQEDVDRGDDDFTAHHYDAEEGWACYV